MTTPEYDLDPLELPPVVVGDVLRCLVNTIVFHRSLGVCFPYEGECQHLDLSYMKSGDTRIEKMIDFQTSQFEKQMMNKKGGGHKVILSFYQFVSSMFGKKKVVWEKWIIKIKVNPPAFSVPLQKEKILEIETNLRERLFFILQQINNVQYNLPDLNPKKTFPFDLTLTAVEADSWFGGIIKKIL